MKKQLLAICGCLLVLAGCGGGGSAANGLASAASRGHASMSIHWPKKTRLIPGDAQCIEVLLSGAASPAVTLTNGTDYVTSPGSGGTSSVTTVQLTAGTYTVTAKAWPGTTPTAGGSPIAVGTASLTITAGQSTSFSITMASTIDHIEVTSNGTTIEVSTSGNVTAGNGGSATTLPLIPTLLNSTTIVPKDASGDNLVLFPASLAGTEVTNGDGTVTVAGAQNAISNSTGSVLTTNLVANAWAASGYSSTLTVNYNEGGSTINSFTVPVQMQAISIGTPAQISVNAQWSALNSVSQYSATGYAMIAYAGGFGATGLTENIPSGYGGSVGGIAPSSSIAFRDANDGYWFTNASAVDVYDLNGHVNTGINGHTGFLSLANNVSRAGNPFVIDASGAYEYSGAPAVSTTATLRAGSAGFLFAAGAAPDGTYTFYTKVPNGWVYATSMAGVDTAVQNATPDAMGASAFSPLLYIYEGGQGEVSRSRRREMQRCKSGPQLGTEGNQETSS